MKNVQIGLLLLTTLSVAQACSGGGKSKGGGAPAPATSDSSKTGNTDGKTNTSNGTDKGSDTTTNTGNSGGGDTEENSGGSTPDDGIYRAYTGFDGKTKFRFIYGFYGEDINLVLSDPSLAKIEQFSYTIPQAKLDAAIAAAKAKDPGFFEEDARAVCGGTSLGTAIIPLKAGKLLISDTYKMEDENGKEVEFTDKTELTINAYTSAQLTKGKARYTTGIGSAANQKACVSCHGTGLSGAPAHDLGYISQWEDSIWEQWVTKGQRTEKYPDGDYTYEASIGAANHSWAFTNDEEMKATIAYVRSIEASDTDTYAEKALAQCIKAFASDPSANSTN